MGPPTTAPYLPTRNPQTSTCGCRAQTSASSWCSVSSVYKCGLIVCQARCPPHLKCCHCRRHPRFCSIWDGVSLRLCLWEGLLVSCFSVARFPRRLSYRHFTKRSSWVACSSASVWSKSAVGTFLETCAKVANVTVTCFRLIAILLRYEVLYLPTESLFLNE